MPVYIHILAKCKAPEQYKDEKWPTVFSCKPEVGDYVGSLDGTASLKISRVEHVNIKEREEGKTVISPELVIHLE